METKADSTVSKKEELQELKGGGLGRKARSVKRWLNKHEDQVPCSASM